MRLKTQKPFSKEALKKIASDNQARRNQVKKRNLQVVNEHFEPDFNAEWPSAVVFQSFPKYQRSELSTRERY